MTGRGLSREWKARIITAAVLACAFGVVLWQKFGNGAATARSAAPTPQDAIYAMFDAARKGDVSRYLASYTGSMESSIRQAVAEKTEAEFARYLRESNAGIKGVAITDPEPLTNREVKVRVEYVYEDRNEAQFMYLEKVDAAWKIARVDSVQRIPTLVPYGTPVE